VLSGPIFTKSSLRFVQDVEAGGDWNVHGHESVTPQQERRYMDTTAESLAAWAHTYRSDTADAALARRSLLDTVAVTLAARDHPVAALAAPLSDAARWAAVGHVLDFDDLHIGSTTHISVVIVPTVLAAGGDARAYLAGAGVMARLGELLGWRHYSAGWHATCTAGAPAAAVAASVSWGLDVRQTATAIALALPGAGGVQAAFGTHGKSLQVGFAADAGLRAAALARAGASADPRALDMWLELVGAMPPTAADRESMPAPPAVPGGLAIKMFPCCYAMQRPIAALRELRAEHGLTPAEVRRVLITTPQAAMHPLIHDRPDTGLEGKFSMPYAVATALLDGYPGFASFTDRAVRRSEARRLVDATSVARTEGGSGLLDGEVNIEVVRTGGPTLRTSLVLPPGSPERPPSDSQLSDKLAACGADVPGLLEDADWASCRELLRAELPRRAADCA
jgi:2-methylcitrate dehydratase PrpD